MKMPGLVVSGTSLVLDFGGIAEYPHQYGTDDEGGENPYQLHKILHLL